MADDLTVKIDAQAIQRIISKLKQKNIQFNNVGIRTLDWGASEVEKHAKGRHFFVGTGRGSSQRAKDGELKFRNPDGSLRFKVRTNNLVNSISPIRSKIIGSNITAGVQAGSKYAERVEKGGPDTRAFPFLVPALEGKSKLILKRLESGLKRLL